MHRQIAGKLTGPVTKWIVARRSGSSSSSALGGFAAKLTDVQNNEASSWLPGHAESTRALEKLSSRSRTPTTSRRGRLRAVSPG